MYTEWGHESSEVRAPSFLLHSGATRLNPLSLIAFQVATGGCGTDDFRKMSYNMIYSQGI